MMLLPPFFLSRPILQLRRRQQKKIDRCNSLRYSRLSIYLSSSEVHVDHQCVVSRLIDSRLRFAPIFVVVKDLCDLLCIVKDVFILTDFP